MSENSYDYLIDVSEFTNEDFAKLLANRGIAMIAVVVKSESTVLKSLKGTAINTTINKDIVTGLIDSAFADIFNDANPDDIREKGNQWLITWLKRDLHYSGLEINLQTRDKQG